MATIFDLGLISYFDFIFPMLIVFAVVFALLKKTKFLGENSMLDSIVAIVAAFTVLLSRTIIDVINFIIPWFAVMIIFLVLLLLIFMMFGLKEATLTKVVSDKSVYWALIGITLIIILAAFGHVLGQTILIEGSGGIGSTGSSVTTIDGSTAVGDVGSTTTDFEKNVFAIIFNPKVLGMMIIFAIAIFTIAFLGA